MQLFFLKPLHNLKENLFEMFFGWSSTNVSFCGVWISKIATTALQRCSTGPYAKMNNLSQKLDSGTRLKLFNMTTESFLLICGGYCLTWFFMGIWIKGCSHKLHTWITRQTIQTCVSLFKLDHLVQKSIWGIVNTFRPSSMRKTFFTRRSYFFISRISFIIKVL